MSIFKCFVLLPTDQVALHLRRYSIDAEDPCSVSGTGFHNDIESIEQVHQEHLDKHAKEHWPKDDHRWPTKCACGYRFRSFDQWQVAQAKLYEHSETGELMTKEEAPAGAMLDAQWLQGSRGVRMGQDSVILNVKTPGGWWLVDGPLLKNKVLRPGAWKRTGTLPNVTVDKPVEMAGFFGRLIEGELISCSPVADALGVEVEEEEAAV
jgi:hypothetical protein